MGRQWRLDAYCTWPAPVSRIYRAVARVGQYGIADMRFRYGPCGPLPGVLRYTARSRSTTAAEFEFSNGFIRRPQPRGKNNRGIRITLSCLVVFLSLISSGFRYWLSTDPPPVVWIGLSAHDRARLTDNLYRLSAIFFFDSAICNRTFNGTAKRSETVSL